MLFQSVLSAVLLATAFGLPQPKPEVLPRVETKQSWNGARGPVATMLPALKWNHNATDLSHLVPDDHAHLFYTHTGESNKSVSHAFASVKASYNVPVVVLEHSSFVRDIKCSSKGIDIFFISKRALQYAQTMWTLDPALTFTTHSHDCGNGQRDHWHAKHISYNFTSLTAEVTAKMIEIPKAMHEVDLVWGTYKPEPTSTKPVSSKPTRTSTTIHKTPTKPTHRPTPTTKTTKTTTKKTTTTTTTTPTTTPPPPTTTTTTPTDTPTDIPGTSSTSTTTSTTGTTSNSMTSTSVDNNTGSSSSTTPVSNDSSSTSTSSTSSSATPGSDSSTSISTDSSSTSTVSTSTDSSTTTSSSSVVTTTPDNPSSTSSTTQSTTPTPSPSAGCPVPTAPTISGFPAAPCGSNFDDILDDSYGYLDFGDHFVDSLKDLAPDLSTYDEDEYSNPDADDADTCSGCYPDPGDTPGHPGGPPLEVIETRSLHVLRKRFSLLAVFKGIVNTVEQVGETVLKAVGGAIVEGVEAIGDFASQIAKGEFGPTIDATTHINIGPKKLEHSPWGDAYLIFKKEAELGSDKLKGDLEMYCVNCGVTGTAHIHGALKFSLAAMDITQANIGVDGNLLAQLNVGLHAQIEFKPDPIKQNIASVGLPGFSIPEIIVIGPEIALDAELGFDIKAEGQILVGAGVEIPNFSANLDLVHSENSHVDGFTPVFHHNFTAQGSVEASVRLGLPLSIGVGIDCIPLGDKGRKMIQLVNTPAITAKAKYSKKVGDDAPDGGDDDDDDDDDDDKDKDKDPDPSPPGDYPVPGDGSGPLETIETRDNDDDDCDGGIEYSLAFNDDLKVDFFGLKSAKLASFTKNFIKGCLHIGGSNEAPKETSGNSDDGSLAPPEEQPGGPSFQDQSNQAISNEDSQSSAGGGAQHGFTYGAVPSMDGNYYLSADGDGNLRLAPSSGGAANNQGLLWASYKNILVSDEHERILHYYPDVMNRYGVSRVRASFSNHVPIGSNVVTLVPYNYDSNPNTKGVYAALDTQGGLFYTVACNIEGQQAKVFLVKNKDTGATSLQDPALENILTGGVVSNCNYIPFTSSGPGLYGA